MTSKFVEDNNCASVKTVLENPNTSTEIKNIEGVRKKTTLDKVQTGENIRTVSTHVSEQDEVLLNQELGHPFRISG